MKLKKSIIALFFTLISIYLITSYSPDLAIRRHLFFINPYQSITCKVNKTNFVDKDYGRQYTVNGFVNKLGMGIYFAYTKKNSLGWYYWSGGGSGP